MHMLLDVYHQVLYVFVNIILLLTTYENNVKHTKSRLYQRLKNENVPQPDCIMCPFVDLEAQKNCFVLLGRQVSV